MPSQVALSCVELRVCTLTVSYAFQMLAGLFSRRSKVHNGLVGLEGHALVTRLDQQHRVS